MSAALKEGAALPLQCLHAEWPLAEVGVDEQPIQSKRNPPVMTERVSAQTSPFR